MRAATVDLFQFSELEDEVQAEVIERMRCEPWLWGWNDEYWESAQAFGRIAPMEIHEADYDRGLMDLRWTGAEWDYDIGDLHGLRAWKWLLNNGWFDLARDNAMGGCTLTGFCADCNLFDPIYELRDKPLDVPDLREVFADCYYAWMKAAQDDLWYAYSDEGITELLISDEAEYTRDGTPWTLRG